MSRESRYAAPGTRAGRTNEVVLDVDDASGRYNLRLLHVEIIDGVPEH